MQPGASLPHSESLLLDRKVAPRPWVVVAVHYEVSTDRVRNPLQHRAIPMREINVPESGLAPQCGGTPNLGYGSRHRC
jgi:hypothetical protein